MTIPNGSNANPVGGQQEQINASVQASIEMFMMVIDRLTGIAEKQSAEIAALAARLDRLERPKP